MIINVKNDEMLGRTNDKALHITLIEQQKEIERLNNTIDSDNDVIKNQDLEIERLNKENKTLQDMDKILRNENTNLKLRISKAIEYIKYWTQDDGIILSWESVIKILEGEEVE